MADVHTVTTDTVRHDAVTPGYAPAVVRKTNTQHGFERQLRRDERRRSPRLRRDSWMNGGGVLRETFQPNNILLTDTVFTPDTGTGYARAHESLVEAAGALPEGNELRFEVEALARRARDDMVVTGVVTGASATPRRGDVDTAKGPNGGMGTTCFELRFELCF